MAQPAGAPAPPALPTLSAPDPRSRVTLILGREPALWAGLLNAVIYLLGAYTLKLSAEKEAVLVAVVAALLGMWVAWRTHDGVSAAILGFVKAAFALFIGFGGHMTAQQEAQWLAIAAAVVALFVRTQATAKVSAEQLASKSLAAALKRKTA